MLNIETARPEDFEALQRVYAAARRFMEETGNPDQWGKTSPRTEVLQKHLDRGNLYAVKKDGRICGAFAFIPGEDPTYGYIDGAWGSDAPYAAIHCVASDGTIRGVFRACVDFCGARCGHLRIDTYKDNVIMQRCIEGQGFVYRGVIYLANGSPRMAYDRISDK